MSDELDRLRAFAAEYEKITGEPAKPILRKIACLEAAADPWREAKRLVEKYRGSEFETGKIVGYCDHLTAEVDRLEKRVAELEAEHFRLDPETGTLEVDHIGPEPVLDAARVLATAAMIYGRKGLPLAEGMCRKDSKGASPYKLKGGDK